MLHNIIHHAYHHVQHGDICPYWPSTLFTINTVNTEDLLPHAVTRSQRKRSHAVIVCPFSTGTRLLFASFTIPHKRGIRLQYGYRVLNRYGSSMNSHKYTTYRLYPIFYDLVHLWHSNSILLRGCVYFFSMDPHMAHVG